MLQFQVQEFNNFPDELQGRVHQALQLAENAINSSAFEKRVLDFHHAITGKNEFERNNGLSNQQVLEKIKGARPALRLELETELQALSIVTAYRNPGSDIIHIYPPTVRDRSLKFLAGTLTHEWLHLLGFGHSFEPTPERDSTVPYAVAQIVEEIIQSSPKKEPH